MCTLNCVSDSCVVSDWLVVGMAADGTKWSGRTEPIRARVSVRKTPPNAETRGAAAAARDRAPNARACDELEATRGLQSTKCERWRKTKDNGRGVEQ